MAAVLGALDNSSDIQCLQTNEAVSSSTKVTCARVQSWIDSLPRLTPCCLSRHARCALFCCCRQFSEWVMFFYRSEGVISRPRLFCCCRQFSEWVMFVYRSEGIISRPRRFFVTRRSSLFLLRARRVSNHWVRRAVCVVLLPQRNSAVSATAALTHGAGGFRDAPTNLILYPRVEGLDYVAPSEHQVTGCIRCEACVWCGSRVGLVS